ncbi:MAG: deoxyguanosinetriphosphate triphosphohydrolase [Bacillota bacterium]|nr:deoxyguanosinetriphosphate triphosphohydrolase [Bacillota bacterium]
MIREKTLEIENMILSKYATKSIDSKGRRIEEEKCSIRTDFQRDRDRIIHSKAFRRLKHKTQVFLSPEGDHYRTRLTHTLEVSQISRTIARALRVNEDLTEAIALGHDIGHTPFGHCGEEVLNRIYEKGFSHNEQSLRVVDYLEKRKVDKEYGLNLTYEVRNGILNHRGDNLPSTLEGKIVRVSDRIAYINHDIDDALRANVLTMDSFPKEYLDVLGVTHGDRINNLIIDVINSSTDSNYIKMSKNIEKYFLLLRDFMFENVYLNKNAKKEESKASHVIEELYYYFVQNPSKLPKERYEDFLKSNNDNEAIKDYIAGMTDRYAISKYKKIFVPEVWI